MDVLQVTELGIVDIGPSVMVSEVECTHQLPSQKWYCPDHKFEMALNKQILKRMAKALDHYCIKTRFSTEPMDTRGTCPSLELGVDMKLTT